MTLATTLRTLGDTTAARITRLWALTEQGTLTTSAFLTAAGALIGEANAQAWIVAQTGTAAAIAAGKLDRPDIAAIGATYGDPTDAPVGVTLAAANLALQPVQPDHRLDVARITEALATITGGPQDQTIVRLERLARAEPAETGQRAANLALTKYPGVRGWTRNTGGEACQLCTWWARDGAVFPPTQTMPTHKGCLCTPTPVLA